MISIFKLKKYEKLTLQDMQKNNHIRIEDFSVYMAKIPINKEMYNNDTNILSAILIPYLEEEITQELIGKGFQPAYAKEVCQIV